MTPEVFDLPLAKRQKLVTEPISSSKGNHQQDQQQPGSRIFSPFRTLGLVSPTSVPFTSVPLGKTTFQITTSVGRCLQTYDLRRGLSLVFLTRPQTPTNITATYAWKDRVFAAWGGSSPNLAQGVWVFKRGKKLAELEIPAHTIGEPIEQLIVFGSWIVGCGGTNIHVWKSTTYEHYTTLTPHSTISTSGGRMLVGKMCTMPTYLNKIFVGKCDGCVDIWNVGTGKLVFTILPTFPDAGAVTALQPAPVLSLLSIAYSSGALTIHNIRTDQPLLQLRKPGGTNNFPISSISFRTDEIGAGEDGRKAGVMATASASSGDITMWDLNDGGRVTGILRGAHQPSGDNNTARIDKIEFLSGQPVIISTGSDNSLRSWIFDESPFSPIPRPLHGRAGHSAPITKLMFLPSGSDGSDMVGKWLLSAGQDRSLYGLSLRKDSQNTELSQGKVKSKAKKIGASTSTGSQTIRYEELKAPEITCLACSLNRDGGMGTAVTGPIWTNAKAASAENTNSTGWESVITGHKGDKFARTWVWGKKKAGRWAFETGDGTEVKSVAISQCGSFALIGSDGGSIEMYNLQSGIRRHSFPPRSTQAEARKRKFQEKQQDDEVRQKTNNSIGHTKAVTGIVVNNLNTRMISCGLDGKVKFWDFVSGKLTGELDWHPMCSITGLRFSSSNDLIAFSCDDLSIRVVDVETKKLVRELWGCVGQVNDFCISNDGRWIVAASMDSVIRVWDLPTGHLIDAFRLEVTCTALAFSSTGEFLATAHADGVGINVWNNRSLFMHVPTSHIEEEEEEAIAEIAAPTASGEGGLAIVDAAFNEYDPETRDRQAPILTPDQLGSNMMTLSITPKTKWQTLLHLDTIKASSLLRPIHHKHCQRNKPKEAPKKPKAAPFFLPSLQSSNPGASLEEDNELRITPEERTRIARLQRENGTGTFKNSEFTSLLHSKNFIPFVEYLKTLSPAKSDLEIRSLNPISRPGSENELALFVEALTARLNQKRDFELVNTWMAVFLRVHSDSVEAAMGPEEGDQEVVSNNPALRAALGEWKREQESEVKRLANLVSYCRGVVGFLRAS
ncbi:hypothetical protein FQN57_007339 [Myotisia sp. PD_48]|nr:hypothetical protein FQN57_007339 [Myotisia sp. PD_48]